MLLVGLLRNVVVKDMTILAPLDSPNTDGIDPGTESSNLMAQFYLLNTDGSSLVISGLNSS